MSKAPTEKQIYLVDKICKQFHIDFPFSSKQFTKYQYSKFISAHIEDLREAGDVIDEDYLMDICVNDVWCEYY